MHPTYKDRRAALDAYLKRLGISRYQLKHLERLSNAETWAYQWVRDDWPHA